MSDYTDILTQIQKTEALIQERDMAAAYIRITDEMGPCPQLLAFVNYDNTMVGEDGVALESMNLFDQHNLLVSKLDVDALDTAAMESLSEVLKKYRGVLVVGGVAARVAGFGGSLLPLAAIIAGGIGFVKNVRACNSVKDFSRLTQVFDLAYSMDSKFASAIPTTLDQTAWVKFTDEHVYNPGDSVDDSLSELKKKLDFSKPDFDKSGWTPDTYSNAVKWMVTANEKLDKAAKTQEAKIEKILSLVSSSKNIDSKTSSLISATVKEAARSMDRSLEAFDDVKEVLRKVGRNFEKK